jgi:hypothetical protein
MKKAIVMISVIIAAAISSAAISVEEARANFIAARKVYFEAIGRTNGVSRAAKPKKSPVSASKSKVLTKDQADFLNGRRIAVSRDTETIPGSVITTWYRNGKPDTKMQAVVTNRLHKIVGAEQNNPLQNELILLNNAKKAAKKYEKNLQNVLKALNKAKDKATAEDEAELYQSLIDIIDNSVK